MQSEKRDDGSDDNDRDGSPRLTQYAELHGCSCKVGQDDLDALLAETGPFDPNDDLLFGVGEDAAARQLTEDLAMVTTIDFFTPIVDDPYDFGRVAACNAASDAFATGAVDNLTGLVAMGLPRELTDTAAEILAGIVDAFEAMDGVVAGGHTTLNPWPFAGAAVTATASPDDLLTASGASPGERLYLTKPLGTQPAMGSLRVRDEEFEATVKNACPRPVEDVGREAIEWMTSPNREGARIVREYATTATDVTGFGLLGQARIIAERSGVGIEITEFPVIEGTLELSRLFGYGLESGESAETSGGLLVSVPADRAEQLEASLSRADVFFHPIGRVTDGENASIADPSISEVTR
ncbi:selenide, water dikinase [Halalkaliarchaeum desulfuricum]|uniref:Selenide, water dikinase n=1 Tax=Halalkaliarchaeum desulfuricum TaxID=2055893 RepID=A0A343TLZ4_9EURY|nr:selenide, water dikinase SelD [Halalkaliarchaeum desulfuricum]AUX10116.1 selenide, water dikinase [Halalkaliarchaeum desulfuricum]